MHRGVQALGAIAIEIDNDFLVTATSVKVGREFGSDDHLIAHAALLHPFSDPPLGLLGLVVVRGIEEVPPFTVEVVQDTLGSIQIAGSHCSPRPSGLGC